MGFNLDPDTEHYLDRDAKKRLNNLSSMADIRGKCQFPALCGGLPVRVPPFPARPRCEMLVL